MLSVYIAFGTSIFTRTTNSIMEATLHAQYASHRGGRGRGRGGGGSGGRNLRERLAEKSATGGITASAASSQSIPTYQVRFPKMSYNLSETLNHWMFKDVEFPLLLTDCGAVHITQKGYRLFDLLGNTAQPAAATLTNETEIYDDYLEGLPLFVNTHYSECDIVDRDYSSSTVLSHIPYIHADLMLYRSYYRANEKSRVTMVVERLHKKHHIRDIYFIVHGNLCDEMIREDINSFLQLIKEYA